MTDDLNDNIKALRKMAATVEAEQDKNIVVALDQSANSRLRSQFRPRKDNV